jgi:hypothetical protein
MAQHYNLLAYPSLARPPSTMPGRLLLSRPEIGLHPEVERMTYYEWCFRGEASGIRLQGSGFRDQASGVRLQG